MANVQKQFEEFHDNIRIDYDMSKPLREKRDIILDRIRKHLKEKGRPGFKELLQGSYALGVGVSPIAKLEYDIDVGLRFEISAEDYSAKDVYKWVLEAVEGHTDEVAPKGPCIRVKYATGDFHVDLVSYAWQTGSGGKETFKLAHGTKGWRPSDPPALLAHVDQARKRFEKTEDGKTQTDQYRRCVRYFKRWNDEAIPEEVEHKPTGLAFVLLCAEKLQPTFVISGKPDDLAALRAVASWAATAAGRLVLKKPTPEFEDMLARLSDEQMTELKKRFADLVGVLDKATREPDPVKACKLLQKVFGKDFPVPAAEETAARTAAPAIITSSSSA